jgi:hypothetical protein
MEAEPVLGRPKVINVAVLHGILLLQTSLKNKPDLRLCAVIPLEYEFFAPRKFYRGL